MTVYQRKVYGYNTYLLYEIDCLNWSSVYARILKKIGSYSSKEINFPSVELSFCMLEYVLPILFIKEIVWALGKAVYSQQRYRRIRQPRKYVKVPVNHW